MYIHELAEWPQFSWNEQAINELLLSVRHQQGRLLGHVEALGFSLQQEAQLQTLTADVVKSSEIEGEVLDAVQVRSSLARRLGIDIGALKPVSRQVDGVVKMVLDATRHYDRSLTEERLFSWQQQLFPTGRSGLMTIRTGAWRDEPMQIVSGPLGSERVHFEAPAADRLSQEMEQFLHWFEAEDRATDLVLHAACAHLWFVTIHPFADGNGRIARALTDMVLARSEKQPQRFYSMSAQIRQERSEYYRVLEQTQKGTLDITHWMEWFLRCLQRAIARAEETVEEVLGKARFWERLRSKGVSLNGRQRLILNQLLDGFEGKLTSSKYATIAKCSQDTAHRDILLLLEADVLVRSEESGRSTSYTLRRE